ncbi:DUF1490 family protein [Mycobacterium sp.]|uniref:DUF1490 family protein n=1 Tax=Mycobacterium sp. TaxID=1785 RepID=UPI003BA8B535
MAWQGLLAKTVPAVVTGVVGVGAYEVVRVAWARMPCREASVIAATWGLRAARKAEQSAEQARLTVADVVAEAAERAAARHPRLAVVDSEQAMAAKAGNADS